MQVPGRRQSRVRGSRATGEAGKALPLLGDDDRSADRAYARQFLLDDDREYGKPHNLEYAERFYYIDQRRPAKSKADEYIEKNVVRI